MNQCLMPWSILINFFVDHQCDVYYLAPAFDGSFPFSMYLPYFLKTLLLELPIYYFFLRNLRTWKEIVLINLNLNLATHPILFYGISALCSSYQSSYLTYLISAEIFAPLVETLLLIFVYKVNYKKAITAAVIANLISWSVGIWL